MVLTRGAARGRMLLPSFHQLPVHSPQQLSHIARAAARLCTADDPRDSLATLLRAECGADGAILLGSGTQALQLAIGLAHRHVGSEGGVALPAFGCFDLASAVIGAGVGVQLYDIDPASLGPDWSSLEANLRKGARVVVAAPLYGIPIDWASLRALADRYDAVVIEDAAQGHGGSWHGAPLGSLGDLSVLSFGRGKGWTGGQGGAVLLRGEAFGKAEREALAGAAPSLVAEGRVFASNFARWLIGRPGLYGIPRGIPALGLGETRYHPPIEPAPLPKSAAALVFATHEAARAEAAVRRGAAARFRAALLAQESCTIPDVPEGGTAGYLRFPVRVQGGLAALPYPARARRLGIAPSYPSPLSRLPALQPVLVHCEPSTLRGSEELARSLITLPTHPLVTPAERSEILGQLSSQAPGHEAREGRSVRDGGRSTRVPTHHSCGIDATVPRGDSP